LLSLGTDEEHLAGSDAVVDPDLVCGYLITCFIGDANATVADTGSVRHEPAAKVQPKMPDPAHSPDASETRRFPVVASVAGWGRESHFPVLVARWYGNSCQDTRVSGLWTPSGEYEPEETSAAEASPEETSLEEQAEYEALVAARAELAAIPVPDIVANHAVGLWQLAILHLTPDPAPDGTPTEPRLREASLAIDALAALVDTLGPRLAPHDETLREAVTQLRLAFVQVSGDGPTASSG
jgi:hypothetical protein